MDRWTLLLTTRRDWVTSDFTSYAFFPPAGHYNTEDTAPTYRAGLSYLFDFGLSPFITYATSFTPNLGADLDGKPFKPTTGEGTEIGLKFKPPGVEPMVTTAVFDITQRRPHGEPDKPALQRADRCGQGSRLRVRGKGEYDARAGAHSRLQPPRSQGHHKASRDTSANT